MNFYRWFIAGLIYFITVFSAEAFNVNGDESNKNIKISIVIVDEKNREPLRGANLVLGNSTGRSTNSVGIAELAGEDSIYKFKVSYVGYRTVTGIIIVKNGNVIPDTIFLRSKLFQVDQVVVTTYQNNWMEGVSKPEELPSDDMMRKKGSVFGNSIKSYDYSAAINTSGGKTKYFGLDERAISQRINGIPVRDVFFSFYRPYFGENSRDNLFIHPPPSEPNGILVLDSRTDFSKIKKFKLLASIDQARTQISASGPIGKIKTDKNLIQTKYDFSLDGNLARLYGIDILRPKHWQGLGTIQTLFGSNIFTISGLYNTGSIEINYDHYKPFDNIKQMGLSIGWEKISEQSSIELSYVINKYNHTSGYTQYKINEYTGEQNYLPQKNGSLNTRINSNELIFSLTNKWNNGKTKIGFNTRYETWESSYFLPELPNMFALRTTVFSDSLENRFERIAPGYAYMMATWNFNNNWRTEFGFIFAYDFLAKKEISPGPHIGISYISDKKVFMLDFLTSIRYMDHIYQSFNTDVSKYNYALEERPLAHHSSLKMKFNDLLFKNTSIEFQAVYLSLMNQHKAYLSEIPEEKIINEKFGGTLLSDLEAERLRSSIPAFSNVDDQKDIENMINLLSQKDKIKTHFNTMNYKVDHNKESVSLGFIFKWAEYFWASVNLSRTTYGSPFNPNSIPTEDDIGIIAKVNSLFYYFGKGKPKNLSTQISLVYYGGERYTPYLADKNLAKKLKIERGIDLMRHQLDPNKINFLERETVRQGERNSRQYPASIFSTVSINYRFPIFNYKGGFGFFISDWHQLIPGIERNIYNKQYKMKKLKFIEESGEGEGIYGGINFILEF